MNAILGVRRERRGPQPHLIVEARRYRLRRGIAGNAGLLGQDDFDPLEFADATVPNQFGHAMVLRHRAILGTRLEDALGFAHRVHQHLAFVNGQRGLLALHVLARLERHQADQRVPVVWRGDHHGIDILAGQHLVEIPGGKAILVAVVLVHGLLGAEQSAFVDVADREDLGGLLLAVECQVPGGAMIAHPDEPHGDAFAGWDLSIGAEYGRRNDRWEAGDATGHRGAFQK
jgi:hypothetical protein